MADLWFRRAATVVVVALLAACTGAVDTDERAAAPTFETTTTTAPAPATAPVVAPVVLPQPVVPPDPDAFEPYVVLGTIEIPTLGVTVDMASGITLGTLDRGPGHWPGTPMPGEIGNMVVAGHRVTHTRPFRHIDQLVVGDEVVFTVDGQRHVYLVVGDEIVTPHGMHIIDQTPARTATLFACHPPGSARYRYVVHLELAA